MDKLDKYIGLLQMEFFKLLKGPKQDDSNQEASCCEATVDHHDLTMSQKFYNLKKKQY